MEKFQNVTILDHPLIRHKVAILRSETTSTKEFRELVEEITMLMAYESFKDIPTKEILVKTPLEICTERAVVENSVAIIPVLRAGLGMVGGVHKLFPTAKVGHIGLYRDEETLEPKEYYLKLPDGIDKMTAVVLDPMLATGGSASAAIAAIKARGAKSIKLMSIIAAPQGVKTVAAAHPDVQIYVATLDRTLNDKGYILPGLGDAGDRMFGTK
ncbi:MAG TPA: uracil phosphoribosyltransferase [Clostridia bacterium]|nr:uracil phosphoribosyltransferase [Clostridia bacterium]HRU84629.1 uracil phosphoribosyltransferase [Eubacteriales bacterium]